MRTYRNYALLVFIGISLLCIMLAAIVMANRCSDTACSNGEEAKISKNLTQLIKKRGSQADTSHIADGILPPTNSWISGAVLQADPKPVFPLPLSIKPTISSYEVGLPQVKTQKGLATAPHTPAVTALIPGAAQVKLTRFDKISAALTYYDAAGNTLGVLTIAEGSPYSFYQAESDQTVELEAAGTLAGNEASYRSVQTSSGRFGIALSKGSYFTNQTNVTLTEGKILSIFAIGTASETALRGAALNIILGASVKYERQEDSIETTITYNTANGQPTLAGRPDYNTSTSGDYQTLYGPLSLKKSNDLRFSVPFLAPASELDIAKLPADQKKSLKDLLARDILTTKIDAKDVYFSGKQLMRAANLLSIAVQLGEQASAASLKSLLNQSFARYLNKQAFYYDTQLKGVAAQQKSFGSEEFNDHHFHYGYYLYAASILAQYDEKFIETHRAQLDNLAADIAQPAADSTLPQTRNYDPYKGHSWAAGLAPFTDGNNQESSSEALNAWNAVALWGKATHNSALTQTGEALLANEAYAARSLWREPILSDYTEPLVSLNWGAKREYATFFSSEPSAKLGIQLIPMSPVFAAALKQDNVDDLIRPVIQDNNYNVLLGDYILMYYALAEPNTAARLIDRQQDVFIDNGNSRTYMYAWIHVMQR